MQIAIDVRTINKPRSGVGYYVTNLIREMRSFDRENEYCLIANNGTVEREFGFQPNFCQCQTTVSNENHLVGDLWENTVLPYMMNKKGIEVFHGPAFMIPLLKGNFKTVATIHDIVSYIMPETIPLKYSIYMKGLIKVVTRRADKIITDSRSTKEDLVGWLNVPEEKIEVVHLAVDSRFRPSTDKAATADEIRKKYGIRGRFMFFVGNLEPRKNLIRLMKSFARVRKSLGHDYQLVISGKKGWLHTEIIRTFEKNSGEDDIIMTGYISEEDIIKLYQSADMFVFPTLYEGFGLPVLEAMACGTPVITSNTSSIPEVADGCAICVDPTKEEEIGAAMLELDGSPALRAELSEKGLARAKHFSWNKTARETLAVYKSIR